ncbi:MAG: hypothetical protein K0S61_2050 [Anaerocolumna sp.]|jgi:hypothetical protein|nr:hypothetical protein [Anaerocolumna sp.]
MEFKVALNQNNLIRGELEAGGQNQVVICPEDGLDYILYNKDKEGQEWNLEDARYFVLNAKVLEENSLCFQLSFYENKEEEPSMRIIFGLLPQVDVGVPISLEILDSQTLFPERTEGRLKMSIFGKPVRVKDVEEIRLQTAPGFKAFRVGIKDMFFTEEYKPSPLVKKPLIDELGQWIPKNWSEKLSGREQSNLFLRDLLKKAEEDNKGTYEFKDWDCYGGYTKLQFQKTGWFHIEERNHRFWMVDPLGNGFISTGLDCINPGESTRTDPVVAWLPDLPKRESEYEDCYSNRRRGKYEFFNFGISNLIHAFGKDTWKEAWMKIVKMYLTKWGINTIGNWSDLEFISYAKMPYVIPMDLQTIEGFPMTQAAIFRDFPDVFAKEYEEKSLLYAEGLLQFKDDPYLVGYFMRNEPEWAFVYELNIAEEMLASPYDFVSKDEFISRMKNEYELIEEFNKCWNLELKEFDELRLPLYKASKLSDKAKEDLKAFSVEMITRYVELPAKALRKVDPNHLNLGMRYAYITDSSLLSGSDNFDVFSINSYQITPLEAMNLVGEMLNKPVMIGEFHQGALDKGLTAHGIRGVTTQKERGVAYRYYVEQAIKSQYYLGAHYFQLNDQSCLGRFDGENYQIGLIDVCMNEYIDMTKAMQDCHNNIYHVALGETQGFDKIPQDIPPIHY